jgi:hypothetical protein
MPFSIRPSRRFPVCCPVTYQCGDFRGSAVTSRRSLSTHGDPTDSEHALRDRGMPIWCSEMKSMELKHL